MVGWLCRALLQAGSQQRAARSIARRNTYCVAYCVLRTVVPCKSRTIPPADQYHVFKLRAEIWRSRYSAECKVIY